MTIKRKIRKKVETVMGDITDLRSDNKKTLSELIAQRCLFQRKNNFEGKDIVRSIFERLEKQRGVCKTCKELPEELWQKQVDEMCVPDWIPFLCKLESRISDDGWQTVLNRTRLGKSGVSCILIPFILFIIATIIAQHGICFKPLKEAITILQLLKKSPTNSMAAQYSRNQMPVMATGLYLTLQPIGRFRFTCLPFGLCVSQDIFQQKMDFILEKCPGTVGIADGIAVMVQLKQSMM